MKVSKKCVLQKYNTGITRFTPSHRHTVTHCSRLHCSVARLVTCYVSYCCCLLLVQSEVSSLSSIVPNQITILDVTLDPLFLANVNSSSCSLLCRRPSVCRLSVCRLSVVCLSVVCLSVTFVRPTQTIEIFGNVSTL